KFSEGRSMAFLVQATFAIILAILSWGIGTALFADEEVKSGAYYVWMTMSAVFTIVSAGLYMSKTGVKVDGSNMRWATYFTFLGYEKTTWIPFPKEAEYLLLRNSSGTYQQYNRLAHGSDIRVTKSYEIVATKGGKEKLIYEFVDYQPAYKFIESLGFSMNMKVVDEVLEQRQEIFSRKRRR
ncbi:MAG: hypothetical protein AAF193_04480, partial [Bacteroidota bacterium]